MRCKHMAPYTAPSRRADSSTCGVDILLLIDECSSAQHTHGLCASSLPPSLAGLLAECLSTDFGTVTPTFKYWNVDNGGRTCHSGDW